MLPKNGGKLNMFKTDSMRRHFCLTKPNYYLIGALMFLNIILKCITLKLLKQILY